MNTNKKIKWIRASLLSAILFFVTYKAYMHNVLGGGSEGSPSVHALCPYGGLESLYIFLLTGSTLSKIFTGTVIVLVMSLMTAVLFRRAFCGTLCPFGAIQEFFAFIGKKGFKKRFILPAFIDRPLRYLKYAVLALTTGAAWKTGELWMSPYDPWAAYAHIFEGPAALIDEFAIGTGLLLITVAGSALYDRFFCKYLCPMGAFLGLVSKLSPSKIERNKDVCIDCGICAKTCPVNIAVDNVASVKSIECINCQKCILSCPKEGALKTIFAGKNIKPALLMSLVLLLFFGGIGLGKLSGYAQFLPEPVADGELIQVDEIKGYMTLEEVSKYIGMPIEEMYEKLGIESTVPSDAKFKEISNYNPDIDTHAAKDLLKSE